MIGINCPNKNLPEWKELVEVVGENKAHYLWNQNKGWGLDKTPNGQPSKLFSDLLSYYDGDRNAAIQAKAKVYSQAFKNWFGDWLSKDKTNVSKVVDKNGEPLVVWHGGAKDITTFRISADKGNTDRGYYTDPQTGEQIPVDSARTVFFSSNKYVGVSYQTLYALQLYSSLYYRVNSLLDTVYDGKAEFNPEVFKSLDEVLDTLQELSEFNPRFKALKDYIIELQQRKQRLNPKEVNAFRQMLIEVRDKVKSLQDNYLMNRSEWEEVLDNSKQFLEEYNNEEGIEALLSGKIPDVILKEWQIYKKIEQQREKQGLPKIDNYKELHVTLSRNLRYYLIYDGQKLKLWDPSYEDKYVQDLTKEELKETFDILQEVNKSEITEINQEEEYNTLKQKSQLYPVFLNIRNPFVHDYEGTHQGQGYKQSQKLTFGYVAARQVNKAIKDGNDGVIYENIYDPYLADNYAVFTTNQIKSIDNIGSFSTLNDNIYYKKGNTRGNNNNYLQTIGNFTSTNELISWLLNQDGIKAQTKLLLNHLLNTPTRLIIRDVAPKGKLAFYDGTSINLYADIISKSDIQSIAEDVAHEMLHHYLQKYYDENIEFQNQVKQLQDKYRKYFRFESKPYGLRKDNSADEFLMEFMSNTALRRELRWRTPNLFHNIITFIAAALKKLFTGKTTKLKPMNQDLQQLQDSVYELLHQVDIRRIDVYNEHNSPYEVHYKLNDEQASELNKTYKRIQQGLKDRLKSIKRYTNKNPKTWNRLNTIIQQLQNSEAEQGIVQFMEHVNESLVDSFKFLNRPIDQINAKQINQLSRDYIGFYKPLVDNIMYLLDTTDILKEMPNYEQIKQNFLDISSRVNTINNRFSNIMRAKAITELQTYLQKAGMPADMLDKVVEWINNTNRDTSIISRWVGMNSNSDNAVIQVIAKLINDTMNQTDRDTTVVGLDLINLLAKAKKVHGTDVQKLLYEKLNDGTYSGNWVMPVNHGQYRKDKTEFLDKLAERLGISKDEEGLYVLPEDTEIQDKWYKALDEFNAKHSIRRFKPEYYSLKSKILSKETREALDELNSYIDNIVSTITIDGIEYTNLLSDLEYRQLQDLRKQKKLLVNEYNLDGTIKTGTDLKIAKELQEFYNVISDKVKYKTDIEAFSRDEQKVIARYGKDSKEYKEWYSRNTKQQYTQEFYDRIERLPNSKQSPEIENLLARRRALLQILRDSVSGDVTAGSLSDSEKTAIRNLDGMIAKRREYVAYDIVGDRFSDFAEVVPTDEYYRDAEEARNSGAYNEWYNNNHYEDVRGQMRPASYYTKLKPIDRYLDQYTETVPTGRYSTVDPSSEWFDERFDPNGPSVQPNPQLYDNHKQYDQIVNSKELKELYDALLHTMQQANQFLSFMTNSNDSRAPQIPARWLQVVGREGILGTLKYSFDELVTTQADDIEFAPEEFSTMPNGDPIKVIPTRYIKRLKNPNQISTDAVGAVVSYYEMAANYKNMRDKQDEIELLLNLLRQIQISNKKSIKPAGSSNAYQQAQLLVDRLVYGRRMNPIEVNVLGREINVSKILNIVRSFITKVNLSGNIWSIGTSFFTDATYTTMEAQLGRFLNKQDLAFAAKEYSRLLPSIMSNIGNPQPKNKLAYLMLLNQVVKSNKETFDRLDQSQVLRSINQNFWYAGYTMSDYTVKSHTLLSIYHNYRFVDGEGFMSENEYINKFYPNDRAAGKQKFREIPVTLYDAYEEQSDGSTVVSEKYKKYITTKLQDDVRNRIEVLSRRIDGTLREVDKSAIHANAVAAYIIMHKNFMIQGLHDRFKRKQFNLDLGVEENGYYRTMWKFLGGIIGNRHFAIKQLLADYDAMGQYEQYAVRRVLYDMLLIVGSTSVALLIASLVDGDDEYDNWVSQSITYLALRSAFEFRTMYNPFEFISMIKSPTAAFTTLENASNIIGLFNPFTYFGENGPFDIIDRGVYEGYPRILRNIIKVTPVRSIIEAADPESKRNYLQNQLMSF